MGNEGHFVWVLNDENKVSKHTVTPGIQDSLKVVINAGLSAGDRVVTDGIDRLTERAKRRSSKPVMRLPPSAAVYHAPGRHHAVNGGHYAGRDYRLSFPAGFGAAGSGLPDHSGGNLYPGASPDVMTSSVTAPLERQFGQMSGLKQMSSQSSGGASVVTLQFQLTLPLDVASRKCRRPSTPPPTCCLRTCLTRRSTAK
jgi:hypothetical protein